MHIIQNLIKFILSDNGLYMIGILVFTLLFYKIYINVREY